METGIDVEYVRTGGIADIMTTCFQIDKVIFKPYYPVGSESILSAASKRPAVVPFRVR